jgi:pyruvate formate-lyase activating enzyme-like uncharacterized protein
MDELPTPLQAILKSLEQPRPESNLETLRQGWDAYLAQARAEVPSLEIEFGGESVHLGKLSSGCRACKAGTWDCIFTTTRCNLRCEFCYSPQALPADYVGSAFGATPAEIAANHARTQITGLSFSGGEPFLEPQKLIEWVAWFKTNTPEKYTWVYTNGLLADEASLRSLGALGLDEIRFDTAATGYTHPRVLESMTIAAKSIPALTVEIPAIPEHAERLLASLPEWTARGVKYLNLHELMYEPSTLSAKMPGKRQEIILEDGHRTEINPASRRLTLAVMKKVRAENLPLAVNDCSLQSKLRQLRGRRRGLTPLTREPYEQLADDETLVSYCVFRSPDDFQFCSSAEVADYPGCRVFRLTRYAPLSLHAQKQWRTCIEC